MQKNVRIEKYVNRFHLLYLSFLKSDHTFLAAVTKDLLDQAIILLQQRHVFSVHRQSVRYPPSCDQDEQGVGPQVNSLAPASP